MELLHHNIIEDLWVEKYRPLNISDMVLSDDYRIIFDNYLKKKEIPHLLCVGKPGGGKSTICRILCSKGNILNNPSDNLLEVNGSAKDTRNIGFVNDVIEPFLKIPPCNDKYKVVFIDEGESLTPDAFKSLKGIIEKYSKFGRFLITSNFLSQFPEAIVSRFQTFIFKQMSQDFVLTYCKSILDKEKIEYTEDHIKHIITNLYPDIRKIVNEIQRNSIDNKFKLRKDIELNKEKMVVSIVLEIILYASEKQKHKISSLLDRLLKLIDEVDFYFNVSYEILFDDKSIPIPARIIINKYANQHNYCLVPKMHFMSMIYEILKSLFEYK